MTAEITEVECPKCKGLGEVYDAWAPSIQPSGWHTEPEVCGWCMGAGYVVPWWATQYRSGRGK